MVAPGAGKDRCLYLRRVVLFDDPWHWERRLRFVWSDALDPVAPVKIVLIQVPNPEPCIAGQILLVQFPRED